MPIEVFKRQVVISSIITVMVIAVIICFCVAMFQKYSPPNEENTFTISGTVTEVYHAVPRGEVVIAMSNGDLLKLVYPWGIRNLYTTIGYDVEQLADLLEGKDIVCRRMNHLPWAVEICLGDIRINNHNLTSDQMVVTRVSIVVLGLPMFALVICGDVMYLQPKYKSYLQEKRKLARKAKRELKKKEKRP
jgi:hypothetical protein